ncbi:protein phosphatase 1L-like [Branchiostoma lanceolatum]|uniref:protein phosphatase 1L-like n=1 Tax=Branchiostoma lanceolatum TaxID=7740 RepID=UPI0034570B67
MSKMDCLQVSAFAEKNGKNTMEDRHFVFRHRNGVYVAGVCDGHGGDFCSDFVARDLPPKLSAEMDYHVDHETAMRRAIRGTDWDLCSRLVGRWNKSGTTAVVSLITDSEIITAWAGDSQAVLVRPNTEAIPLVTVHRCANEKERERIQEAGGTVTCHKGQYRLNGALSVSRSLGDSEYRVSYQLCTFHKCQNDF